jgi:chromosome segregation ATPase
MSKTTQKPLSDDALINAVREAFSKLRTDGLEPSARNVIALTGGKQARVLGAIRAVREEEEAKRRRMEAVPPMPGDLSDALESIWETAWKAADENAAEARRSFSLRIEELEKQASECLAIIDDLEEKNDAITAENAALEAELDEANARCAELRGNLDHALQRQEERQTIMEMMEGFFASEGQAGQRRLGGPV